MESHLDRILDSTRQRVAGRKRVRSFNDLDRDAAASGPSRDFAGALKHPGISLIAEIKRRSPSKGPINEDLDAREVAEAYAEGGAAALSVLTEPEFFGGCLDDLTAAREASGLPALRKDFIVDLYQVPEARAAGADAVLLIVAAVADRGLFKELAAAIAEYRMAALIEVHDPHELDAAFEIEPVLVGINQRNLRTFEVDTGLAAKLRSEIPAGVVVVAESGIATREDARELERAGLDAMLVGESLAASGDPAAAVRALLGSSDDRG